MKALKFYDKEGVGFELFMDYERQSVMLHIDSSDPDDQPVLEFDDDDIDDIIIALVELKNELVIHRNINNNFITEERYSRISRYFLLKFEWSFNKMPGQASNN